MLAARSALTGFLLFAAGCGSSSLRSARAYTPAPSQSQAPTVVQTDPLTAPQVAGVGATLDYWNGLNRVPGQITQDTKQGPASQVRALRQAVTVIRTNPTLGIDAELVAWALRMADLLEERADLTEQSRSPALLAEAFVRGIAGDPFGVGIELNQAQRNWITSARAHLRARHQLRATLTARYSTQFP